VAQLYPTSVLSEAHPWRVDQDHLGAVAIIWSDSHMMENWWQMAFGGQKLPEAETNRPNVLPRNTRTTAAPQVCRCRFCLFCFILFGSFFFAKKLV
jgi:hypothetical protein